MSHAPDEKRSRILIIDDDEVVLATTEALLEAAGYEAASHNGAFGASEVISEFGPDLVLLDVNMPGLSGPSLAELLRGKTWADSILILFYSSSDEEAMQALVADTGANGYVRKGDRDALREKVAEALASK